MSHACTQCGSAWLPAACLQVCVVTLSKEPPPILLPQHLQSKVCAADWQLGILGCGCWSMCMVYDAIQSAQQL